MKKNSIWLILLFLAVSMICTAAGYLVKRNVVRAQPLPAETETAFETETVTEDRLASNQKEVNAETIAGEIYYLVSEDGFLLVFLKDQETICLYTHVPLTDFPSKEQNRLREGIWFSSMMEVFHYLESYTS